MTAVVGVAAGAPLLEDLVERRLQLAEADVLLAHQVVVDALLHVVHDEEGAAHVADLRGAGIRRVTRVQIAYRFAEAARASRRTSICFSWAAPSSARCWVQCTGMPSRFTC